MRREWFPCVVADLERPGSANLPKLLQPFFSDSILLEDF